MYFKFGIIVPETLFNTPLNEIFSLSNLLYYVLASLTILYSVLDFFSSLTLNLQDLAVNLVLFYTDISAEGRIEYFLVDRDIILQRGVEGDSGVYMKVRLLARFNIQQDFNLRNNTNRHIYHLTSTVCRLTLAESSYLSANVHLLNGTSYTVDNYRNLRDATGGLAVSTFHLQDMVRRYFPDN
uniref:Uncharacterized protein n=1 Tax=Rhynchobrunnera orthospora TaxID=210010 RepID=V5W6B0_9HELO|nr:hypothetical protein [Rhynchobrunnera orthospora]AHC02405.1 hypothetical protein [Rhynchobrunnera orthospora]